ncbi:activating signal cointegrator 1 complex subunit 2-like [Ptychodera flava]|uniref:activating signal cointegrator 1 complex subunit 2-like n=1 Tax=Ptychodera flava TaxID=63121 RepID=UPI003969D79A
MASNIATISTPATPLDKQYITIETKKGGRVEEVEALNPKFIEEVDFLKYKPPPDDINDAASLEEWIDILSNIEEDLHWLLHQSHQKFWCQVLFDDSLHQCLDSYLRYAPRMFDHVTRLPQSAMEQQKSVHRLVFMTFLRMSTHKESQEHHITPSAFGEIIYENFLFDIPKLFDLCVLYGGNHALLNKMLTNIFTQQPKYKDDLGDIVPTFLQVFDGIKTKCGLSDTGTEPQKITSKPKQTVDSLSTEEFRDIVFYLCDIGLTLLAFLEIYPPACRVLHQHTLVSRIANFYEIIIPEVEKSLKKRKADHPSLYTTLKSKLSQAKKSLAKLCHLIVSTCCLQPMLDNSGQQEVIAVYVEDYLQVMSSLLSEKHFLCQYNTMHSVQEDVEMIQQLTGDIDETRIRFILEAVNSATAMFKKRKGPAKEQPTVQNAVISNPTSAQQNTIPEDFECETTYHAEYGGGACAATVSGVELESLVSSVKDLLPDLGEGFIITCLEEYNFDTEKVINSLLEDNLTPALQKLDRQMTRDAIEEKLQTADHTLLSQRQNIYDNDDFDVFNKDAIDKSKIHQGKKNKNYKSVLEDKSDIKAMKSRVIEEYDVIYDTMYDDEYDDTYDDNDIGANDNDSADELSTRRPFTTPRILSDGKNDRWSEEEDPDETPITRAPPRDQFVPNPAELREKQQDRMHRSKYKGHDKKQSLVGQPKGKGQSTETERNRRQKEKNKSARANHNRKMMSDRKMNKGMF